MVTWLQLHFGTYFHGRMTTTKEICYSRNISLYHRAPEGMRAPHSTVESLAEFGLIFSYNDANMQHTTVAVTGCCSGGVYCESWEMAFSAAILWIKQ